jgi:hypothetical protein
MGDGVFCGVRAKELRVSSEFSVEDRQGRFAVEKNKKSAAEDLMCD